MNSMRDSNKRTWDALGILWTRAKREREGKKNPSKDGTFVTRRRFCKDNKTPGLVVGMESTAEARRGAQHRTQAEHRYTSCSHPTHAREK